MGKKRQAIKVTPFRRGLTQCPACEKKKRKSEWGDVVCFSTSNAIHYMRCKRCGERFKAIDLASEKALQDIETKEARRQADTEVRGTTLVWKLKREALDKAQAEYDRAEAARKAALKDQARVGGGK